MSNVELDKKYKGPIAWMTQNPVTANLLMLILLLGGLVSAFKMKQEIFPSFDMDIITVMCPYPGASPLDVEQGILLVLEEAMTGVDGVKRISSSANEGSGIVYVELQNGADSDRALSDIKNEVDRITSFPEQMESPIVSLLIPDIPVISVIIAGDEDDASLHAIAEKLRADLLELPDITKIELNGVKALEVSIEISRENLESYGLTLAQVAQQVRLSSIELPGGSVKTESGTILVRVSDRRLLGEQFKNIVIRGTAGGQEVPLGEFATIIDGYQDVDLEYNFNGKAAVGVTAFRVGNETPTKVAAAVKGHLEAQKEEFPESITFNIWDDNSVYLEGRIDLLVRNARTGLLLVIIVLALFLQRRLAYWVALGIPLSFLGTFLVMPVFDESINMISLFALIITLGMVVDDAIIIAENVYHKMNKGMTPLKAAIEGAQEMAVPVVFSILTTVAAFSPLLFLPGVMGKIMGVIPVVVILVLAFSLFESFYILPAHLAHESDHESVLTKLIAKIDRQFWFIDRIQESANKKLAHFIEFRYQPFLKLLINHRYYAIGGALAFFVLVIGTVPAGFLNFRFMPSMEMDIVEASMRLPFGVPIEQTEKMAAILQDAAYQTLDELDGRENSRGMFTKIGESSEGGGPVMLGGTGGSHIISIQLDLGDPDLRSFGSNEFSQKWKDNLPPLVGVESMRIASFGGPDAGKDVSVNLKHRNIETLGEAAAWLAAEFSKIGELTDVENSFTSGKPQFDFALRPGANTLGITSNDVAQTLRSSFYGIEAAREQRGRNEMRVMVRLPEEQRSSEFDVEQLLIPTRQGTQVPLGTVAEMKRSTAPTVINRESGNRQVTVSANVVPGTIPGGTMIGILEGKQTPIQEAQNKKRIANGEAPILPEGALFLEAKERFPGLDFGYGGQEENMRETGEVIVPGFAMALLIIFTLLAIPFKSYVQPFIIMTAIPFGIVGAFIGHLILGYDLSLMSVLGIIALSGVVVNDSLVLVDAANKYRLKGMSVKDALIRAGMRRFRPIMLTSLTTFFGLLPMMFEKSVQAKFLIPMAISLGFGILFVTFIVLLLIPVLYIWLERIRFRMGFVTYEELEGTH